MATYLSFFLSFVALIEFLCCSVFIFKQLCVVVQQELNASRKLGEVWSGRLELVVLAGADCAEVEAVDGIAGLSAGPAEMIVPYRR